MKFITHSLLACCIAFAGCTTPAIQSSPVPEPQSKPPSSLRTGDVLELRFLHRPVAQSEPYRIGIADQLRIDVFNHDELTQERILVLPDGYISLPLIPRIEAGGLPVEELAEQIAARYRQQKIRDPQVNVSVETSGGRLQKFLDSVSQAVGQQGVRVAVELDGTISAPAIAPVIANRPFGEIRQEMQRAYTSEFGSGLSVVVRQVPQEAELAYVIGEVTSPGSVKIDTDMNALMAVARAGGFLVSADLQKVRVYRYSFDRGIDQWEVDLEQSLYQGNHPAAKLQIRPEDVIFVPKSGIAKANDAVDQYIRKMLPTGIGLGLSYDLNPSNSD